MDRITPEHLTTLLADMGLEPRTDTAGRVYSVLDADGDFPHDVAFFYVVEENGWFGIEALADGFGLSDAQMPKALALVNHFNTNAKLPKAFVKSHRIKLEHWTLLSETVHEDCLRELIALVVRMTWNFYIEAKKQL